MADEPYLPLQANGPCGLGLRGRVKRSSGKAVFAAPLAYSPSAFSTAPGIERGQGHLGAALAERFSQRSPRSALSFGGKLQHLAHVADPGRHFLCFLLQFVVQAHSTACIC